MTARTLLSGLFSVLAAASAFAQTEPTPPLGQIVTWKNFSMPATDFQLPAGPCSLPSPLGPSGSSGCVWYQTNVPANPNFTKKYADTGLDCGYTVDIHPTTSGAVFVALMIAGNGNHTGMILNGVGSVYNGEVEMFTLSGRYVFTGITAGVHTVTLWMASANEQSATLSSPSEFLQCFEVVLPPSQD
jgi:hypothetical protein